MQKGQNKKLNSGASAACFGIKKTYSSAKKIYSDFKKTYLSSRKTCSAQKSCFAAPGVCSVSAGVCFSSLLALSFIALNPACENANALTSEELESGSLTSSVSIGFAPSSGSTTLSPTGAAGASGLISVLANVGVTNSGGYSVYLGSSSPNLVGKQSSANIIPGVSGEVSFSNLQDNTWGYYAGEGSSIPESATYKSVSQGQGEVIFANNNSRVKDENKTFVLGFAAKITNSVPADTYENQVTLSVVSNPYQLTLMDIDNMQDMTSQICENTPGLATKQLKDVRDGKYYWVTKLADNKCWMTQNLDLDLSTGVALTPNDSDVKANWSPEYDTATVADENTILADNTGTRSWSLGDYRLTNPTESQSCGYPLVDVAACPGSNATSGLTTNRFTTDGGTTPTSANGDVNAHYLLGNHYQWNAATAGTGNDLTSGQATNSICPKGWKLPESNASTVGTFKGLIDAYEIGSDVAKLTSAPLYFVRGGVIFQDSVLFADAGNRGFYWSSTPNSNDTRIYTLTFWSTDSIYPSRGDYLRYVGISVRCVAR